MNTSTQVQTNSKLVDFLNSRNEVVGKYTHVSMILPLGKHNIQRHQIEDFWKLYCDLFSNDPNFVSGLAERPGPTDKNRIIPVLNDTDIKIPYDEARFSKDHKLYKFSQVLEVVKTYQKYLKQLISD